MKASRILGVLLFSTLPAVAAQNTVVGTIVEVRPDTNTILLRVGVSDGEAIVRRFTLADSARIRMDGGFGRFADVTVGQSARIGYVRSNGVNVAELVEVTPAPPVASSSASPSARAATGIEERRRYVDEVRRTLDVFDGSVEELRQYPEIEGTQGLARRKAAVEELQRQIANARGLLETLSPTGGQEPWARGVDQMTAALGTLSVTHERAWSLIANR